MARSFNQVILMGNLTRDPELKTTPSGQSVCSFSLALNRQWKDQQGQVQEAVDFIDIVAWGALGERVAQYLAKGRQAFVVGRLTQRSWEQEGQKRSKVEVLANDVTFIGGRGEGGDMPSAPAAKPSAKKSDDVVIEDISDEPVDLSEIPF